MTNTLFEVMLEVDRNPWTALSCPTIRAMSILSKATQIEHSLLTLPLALSTRPFAGEGTGVTLL